jgi:ribosomal protein S18 acetylase RimI-like enzyme
MATEAEREACARIMAGSEPWITLGVGYDRALARLAASDREIYVALDDEHGVAGFAVVSMQGVLAGYLQTLAVEGSRRGAGVGAALLAYVERRVFRETPNVFLFVSSFNTRAQAFYAAHGYSTIGRVGDFLVAGHDELLLRKTRGPVFGYAP